MDARRHVRKRGGTERVQDAVRSLRSAVASGQGADGLPGLLLAVLSGGPAAQHPAVAHRRPPRLGADRTLPAAARVAACGLFVCAGKLRDQVFHHPAVLRENLRRDGRRRLDLGLLGFRARRPLSTFDCCAQLLQLAFGFERAVRRRRRQAVDLYQPGERTAAAWTRAIPLQERPAVLPNVREVDDVDRTRDVLREVPVRHRQRQGELRPARR